MIKTDSGQYSNKELVDVLNNYPSRIFNISQEYLPQPYAVGKFLEFVMFSIFFSTFIAFSVSYKFGSKFISYFLNRSYDTNPSLYTDYITF